MAVATYIHPVVNDPSLFSLQPEEPIIPAVVIVISGYTLWRGGGSRSLDLKAAPDRLHITNTVVLEEKG